MGYDTHVTGPARTIPARSTLLLILLLVVQCGYAGGPRTLNWQDLIPPMPADHPLAKLTRYQQVLLRGIAEIRERKARGDKSVSPIELADERNASRQLAKAGIDVDGRLAKLKAYEEHSHGAPITNAGLDGQLVRLPGYVLPLEFGSGKKITEFLLVPWVGACIHTPPPPPNQIVHVKAERAIELDGLFTPVWVTGKMTTVGTKRSLFLTDGSANIDVAYSLRAQDVVPYVE
jgi:hypothetical protein